MATKKKKAKLSTPIIFIQRTEIFTEEFLVCSGADKKTILSFCKRNKLNKQVIEWIEADNKIFSLLEGSNAVYCWHDDIRIGLLILGVYEDRWKFWEILIHEICHIVDRVAEHRRMEKEVEAKAYLFEYLFRNIRRKLMGIDKR